LRTVKAASYDTLAKIRRGEPVKPSVLHRIIQELAKWPELEHAEELLAKLTPSPENAALMPARPG
jgi:hypothetical protein